jgi:hypothetical protein
MRKFGLVAGVVAGFLMVGCSDDSSSNVPSRDALVAEIVKSGGVDEATATCVVDALYSTLSKDDIAKIGAGKEPSDNGKTAFTTAVVDCLTPTTS